MHSCEHLLYIQQNQRAMLSSLCQSQAQLNAHAGLAAEFVLTGANDDSASLACLPPQVTSLVTWSVSSIMLKFARLEDSKSSSRRSERGMLLAEPLLHCESYICPGAHDGQGRAQAAVFRNKAQYNTHTRSGLLPW